MARVSGAESGRLVFARTPAGAPVAECELDAGDLGLVPGLAREATARGCALLWVHSSADLGPAGFTARPGSGGSAWSALRLAGNPLPLLDIATVLDLLPARSTASGVITSSTPPGPGRLRPATSATARPGAWTGLCRFEPHRRYLDGPGFLAGSRSPEAARRLVLGALARLGAGPVTIETWGEPPDVYLELGGTVEEECGGWERALPSSEGHPGRGHQGGDHRGGGSRRWRQQRRTTRSRTGTSGEFLARDAAAGGDPLGIGATLDTLLGPGQGPCLEVGCGTGVRAGRVRELGWTPWGVDISAAMLRHGRDRLPAIRADATRLPARDGDLPAVISVMAHTDMPAYPAVLAEVARVLAPGGRFVHIGVHPCFCGGFADRGDPDAVVIRPGYLDGHSARRRGPARASGTRSGRPTSRCRG